MRVALRLDLRSTAGFQQMENALTVHLQHSGGREKIWSQGEKSRGIWMATEVTFQTSKSAQVRARARIREGRAWRVKTRVKGQVKCNVESMRCLVSVY